MLKIENIPLNQIDFFTKTPEIFKKITKDLKIEINVSSGQSKNIHFEMNFNKKRFFFLNNRIEEEIVDGIVNPHSEALLNSIQMSEGVNSILLQKAGKPYEEELKEYIDKNGKLPINQVFTSSSGKMLNCSKILNVSVPKFDKSMKYKENLAECFRNIIQESEKKDLKSIALPLIGCGVFGFSEIDVFEVMLSVFQENFFKNNQLKSLEEINLCEVDQKKIKNLKDLCCKMVKEKEIIQRPLKYKWYWMNDSKVFKEYDASISMKIDEYYEKYMNEKINPKFHVFFNVFREPGTHFFDLKQNEVVDKSLHRTQIIKKIGKDWYHDNEIYSSQINEILNINYQLDKLTFELFLKEYEVNFEQMLQINVETKFKREIKKNINLPFKKSTHII